MLLTDVTGIPQASLPITEFRDHLKLGTGFGDETVQDAVLERSLRASIAAIEGRTGKVLFSRPFLLVVEDWGDGARQVLPVAPVSVVASVTLKDAAGVATVIAAQAWRLVRDFQRPAVEALGVALPVVPTGGVAEIAFTAGFSAAWASLPADLGQAVLLLAAHYHENRHASGEGLVGIPFGIAALLERWRQVRVTAGFAGGGRR